MIATLCNCLRRTFRPHTSHARIYSSRSDGPSATHSSLPKHRSFDLDRFSTGELVLLFLLLFRFFNIYFIDLNSIGNCFTYSMYILIKFNDFLQHYHAYLPLKLSHVDLAWSPTNVTFTHSHYRYFTTVFADTDANIEDIKTWQRDNGLLYFTLNFSVCARCEN